jgi:hypothetical protein
MKKLPSLLSCRLAVLLLAFMALGFLFVGCDNPADSGGGGGGGGGPTVTISGTPKIGETLTATSTGEFQGNFLWGWMFADEKFTAIYSISTNRGDISGPNNNTLTILPGMTTEARIVAERVDLEGNYIRSNILKVLE